jgi:cephalosporin-C deacetylase-like acetyl esterase
MLGAVVMTAGAGMFDEAWLKGTTDKDPLSYSVGEEIVFTVTPMGIKGSLPEGEYTLLWKRTDDFGNTESGSMPLTGKPLVYKGRLERPGFMRLQAWVACKDGKLFERRYEGDATTPEGRRAMNRFERRGRNVAFDGGAGADVSKIVEVSEPADFDGFWAGQFARLVKVPVKADRIEVDCGRKDVRIYAVRVDCAGLRPVTGYLSVPRAVENGSVFPAKLITHGYSGSRCTHTGHVGAGADKIVFDINAHGLKLKEFGATEADTKALRWEIAQNGRGYAFSAEQNKDPETAYFNGMVLRVKRALQYLKTVEGWNGRELIAAGGSQGGLQTIWAAGCGEGVTLAESSITWCCDMSMNEKRLARKAASDGWYIPWTPSMGYYDAVNFAKRIPASCRTVIPRAGLGDYCCPPTGLMKLWNNIPGNNKKITWVQGSKHGYVPPAYPGRDFTR